MACTEGEDVLRLHVNDGGDVTLVEFNGNVDVAIDQIEGELLYLKGTERAEAVRRLVEFFADTDRVNALLAEPY